MNFKKELLEKELELELLQEEKNNAIRSQEYDKAAMLRYKERSIEIEIKEIIDEVQKMFDDTTLDSKNYSEQMERSLLLMHYVTRENSVLKEKIITSIKRLKKMRTLELSAKNRPLYLQLEEEIEDLKLKFKDCFPC